MKTEELSIGDWVQAGTVVFQGEERLTPPMRVVGIGETWVNLEIDPEQGDPFEEDIKDIRPIPLTADILERNCFENTSSSPYRTDYRLVVSAETDQYLFISLFKKANRVQIVFGPGRVDATISFSKNCCYVHDLQHAMRMCGIEEKIQYNL